MKTKTKKWLRQLFDQQEEIFPDKSTGFLLEVTAQQARTISGRDFDCSDVAEALVAAPPVIPTK
jgi:hypothetical protein